MSTYLVTGGAGYIGSHLCKALALLGHTPVVYDNLSRGHRGAVKWGPLEEGDIADRARLTDVLRRHQPAGVFHFAAFAYVGESTVDPGLYYRNNLAGSLGLLDALSAAHTQGVCGGGLVFSSTCATYGLPVRQPIIEDERQAPINPYGWSKLFVEQAIRDYVAAHGLRAMLLRYFNAAGADPDGEIGENHDPEPHAAPLAMFAAMGRTPGFRVFGGDYDTPDGSAVRDYIHVCDLAEAHIAAMRRLETQDGVAALNLGTGVGTSVLELLSAVEKISGRRIPRVIEARRPGDPPVLVADPSRATAVLNWRPRRNLADIVGDAWRWHTR
jgi:UDP-arabinose 4-epimerase